jgi:superfamily II DNA or RNA helicase
MKEIILEKICENELPESYKFIDLKKFGEKDGKIIELFDYQQDALKNVMNCLNLYYQDREDFYKKYRFNGLDAELEEKVSINKAEDNSSFDILEKHYKTNQDKLEFKSICNRASFWMATGSGKTLVMIKLIEVLFALSKLPKEVGGIPKNDILILAPRPKILNQIKDHIEDFNRKNDLQIELRDLREWEYCKRNSPNLYSENTVTVFYYRSDNLKESGYDTENETNYQNYLHGTDSEGYKFGSWYVILDEAHKGVTGDSKRQNIYQVLAKEGFLFNFSATFTDAIDKATTVFNFNLARFINSGYGKHIKVTNQEFRNFNKRRDDDFSNKEKRKIVLKSLITLAAIKKAKKKIWESIPSGKEIKSTLYHNPLLITIANTIQTTEADLKLFFRELAKIAKEEIAIEEAKVELILEWRESENRIFQFNSGKISEKFISLLSSITYNDIKKFVFNTSGSGSIEIINIEGNQRELAFKMSTANSKPFALLVASDATNWMKDLDNYTTSTDVIAESFFEKLNEPDNEINILLGKQIFAEGWDSNRPNVINFINIGVSDAQKFVLQAMGRE